MIARFKPVIGPAELKAAAFPPDNAVEKFEDAFARKFDADHAVAFAYGRSALYFLLQALEFKDAEILCPAYTCVVVPHAIVESGNTPVFVDAQSTDGNLDWKLAEQAVTPRTRAIMATSIFGHAIDLDGQRAFQRRHPEVLVIQDCAHSFACSWRGTPVQNQGIACIYGLNAGKIIHSIFGGMVSTNDADLHKKLKALQARELNRTEFSRGLKKQAYLVAAAAAFSKPGYSIVHALESRNKLDAFTRYYDPETIEVPKDFRDAMSPSEASVGLVQLAKYDDFVAARREAARIYRDELDDIDRLGFPQVSLNESTFSHIVASTPIRERVIAAGARLGVEYGHKLEYCIPDMPAYKRLLPDQPECPVARELSRTIINLPVSNTFSLPEVEKVVQVTRKIFDA